MPNACEYRMGALMLRLAGGVLFAVAGLNKFIGGATAASRGIVEMFGSTWLPAVLVAPYAYALPYVELTLGVLLLAGLARRIVVPLAGLLMVSLCFGMLVAGNGEVAAHNMIYVLLFAAIHFTMPWDAIALDRVWGSRPATGSASSF